MCVRMLGHRYTKIVPNFPTTLFGQESECKQRSPPHLQVDKLGLSRNKFGSAAERFWHHADGVRENVREEEAVVARLNEVAGHSSDVTLCFICYQRISVRQCILTCALSKVSTTKKLLGIFDIHV